MNNRSAISIKQFCTEHNLSRTLFYSLLKQNKAPKLMYVGRRRMISCEAAAEWRKQMEKNAGGEKCCYMEIIKAANSSKE